MEIHKMSKLNENKITKTNRLFFAVLYRAFQDALKIDLNQGNKKQKIDVKEARQYLTKESKDLETVCDLANVSMKKVIIFANKLKANNWKPVCKTIKRTKFK